MEKLSCLHLHSEFSRVKNVEGGINFAAIDSTRHHSHSTNEILAIKFDYSCAYILPYFLVNSQNDYKYAELRGLTKRMPIH